MSKHPCLPLSAPFPRVGSMIILLNCISINLITPFLPFIPWLDPDNSICSYNFYFYLTSYSLHSYLRKCASAQSMYRCISEGITPYYKAHRNLTSPHIRFVRTLWHFRKVLVWVLSVRKYILSYFYKFHPKDGCINGKVGDECKCYISYR